MTFRSIGELAGNVMQRVVETRAAAAISAAEFEGEPSSREARNGSPIAQAVEGTASNLGTGVAGKAGELARPSVGAVKVVKEPSPQAMRPVLRVIINGKGLRSDSRQSGYPSPALRNPLQLVLVSGHARSG